MGNSLQLRKVADKSGDPPSEGESWPLAYVALTADPPEKLPELADGFVTRALGEGWLSVSKGTLVIHLRDGDLTYKIISGPGRYLNDEPTEETDNPEVDVRHYYNCELVSAPKGGDNSE